MQAATLFAVKAVSSPAAGQDVGAPTLDPGKSGSASADGSVDAFTQALAALMGVANAPAPTTPAATVSGPDTVAAPQTIPSAANQPFVPIPPALTTAAIEPATTALARLPTDAPAAPAVPAVQDKPPFAAAPPSPASGQATPPQALGAASFSIKLTVADAAQPQTQLQAPSDDTDLDTPPVLTVSAEAAALALQPAAGPQIKLQPATTPQAKTSAKLDATNGFAGQVDESKDAPSGPAITAVPANLSDAADGSDRTSRLLSDTPARSDEAQPASSAVDNASLNGSTTAIASAQAPLQTAASLAADGPAIVSQLATQVAKSVDGKSTRFDVALDPAGLGHVDVKVEINAQGQVSAQFSFDNAHAAAEAKSQSGQLQQALEQAGFNVSQGGLSFDVGGQGAGLARQDAPPPQPSTTAPLAADLVSTTSTAVAAANTSRPTSGVDITI